MKKEPSNRKMIFSVSAPITEVTEFLKENWHDERNVPFVAKQIKSEASNPATRADPITVQTILVFSTNAVIGGILYDAIKILIEKLQHKYGSAVTEIDDQDDGE